MNDIARGIAMIINKDFPNPCETRKKSHPKALSAATAKTIRTLSSSNIDAKSKST